MVIILKRIPKGTKKIDIVDYLTPTLKGKIFQKSGTIERIKIQALKDPQTNNIEFHGLVFIDSDEAADRVIKKFNRKVFNGKNIAITEYHERSWRNDPRNTPLEFDNHPESKRKFDRRRSDLKEIKKAPISFNNPASFHRKL